MRGTTPCSPAGGRSPPSSSPSGAPCSVSPASTRSTREQFGRPIAQFQAVRHRLAEAYVALEAGDAAVAVRVGRARPDDGDARQVARRAAAPRIAATHSQQVLAGIGFTEEHPLHRYVKRALLLDGLLGSSTRLPRELGVTLLATRQLPRLLDL